MVHDRFPQCPVHILLVLREACSCYVPIRDGILGPRPIPRGYGDQGEISSLRGVLRPTGRRGQWGDGFAGQAPADEKVVEEAEITWGIHFSDWANVETRDEGGCTAKPKAGTLKIRAYMVPKESWGKSGSKTPLLLRHEQGHFHIAHVYAKLLQRAVDGSVKKGELMGRGANCAAARKDLQRKVEKLVAKYVDKRDKMQKLYDEETEHGTDANKQRIWDRKIKRWLDDPDAAPRP